MTITKENIKPGVLMYSAEHYVLITQVKETFIEYYYVRKGNKGAAGIERLVLEPQNFFKSLWFFQHYEILSRK